MPPQQETMDRDKARETLKELEATLEKDALDKSMEKARELIALATSEDEKQELAKGMKRLCRMKGKYFGEGAHWPFIKAFVTGDSPSPVNATTPL